MENKEQSLDIPEIQWIRAPSSTEMYIASLSPSELIALKAYYDERLLLDEKYLDISKKIEERLDEIGNRFLLKTK